MENYLSLFIRAVFVENLALAFNILPGTFFSINEGDDAEDFQSLLLSTIDRLHGRPTRCGHIFDDHNTRSGRQVLAAFKPLPRAVTFRFLTDDKGMHWVAFQVGGDRSCRRDRW